MLCCLNNIIKQTLTNLNKFGRYDYNHPLLQEKNE